jgi:hypothetical protein
MTLKTVFNGLKFLKNKILSENYTGKANLATAKTSTKTRPNPKSLGCGLVFLYRKWIQTVESTSGQLIIFQIKYTKILKSVNDGICDGVWRSLILRYLGV